MIEQKIDKGIKRSSFFESIKLWWNKRKSDKDQEKMFKPIDFKWKE